jgi:hypothetical protein
MKHRIQLASGVLLLVAITAEPTIAADKQIGGLQLLAGYKHQPLQGIDSIVGRISKPGGLQITYEIGSIPKPGGLGFGGQFSDRPKRTPKNQLLWYKEQTVNGQPMHVAHRKDGYLLVSFPKKGVNFSVKVNTTADVAEVLLMVLTYPNPVAKKPGKAKVPPGAK